MNRFSKFIKELLNEFTLNLQSKTTYIAKDKDYLDNPNKQAKVKRLGKEIDQLVYKLYELTPEEINIFEGFNNG